MHIGFDVSQTGFRKAGCGFYAHSMIHAILAIAPENRYSLFSCFGDFYFDVLMSLLTPYRGCGVHYGPRIFTRQAARAFWTGPDVEAALGEPDIIHSNNFWCPIQLTSTRLIYTFYDMCFAENPDWSKETNRLGCFQGVFRSALAADWVVAISEYSRRRFLSFFPHFPEERVRVVYPCSRFADPAAMGVRHRALKGIAAGGFWLNVGTIEPRKNQDRLIEAYARYLSLGGPCMPLVLAGGKGWLMEGFQARLRDLGLAEQVLRIDYVSDEELVWLYRNCYANLFPSLYEGFGLPVLEGMQFGAPTVASDTTSIPEVTGEAALLLPPEDIDGWARALLRLATEQALCERLRMAARVQAARFDREGSATTLLLLYKEALVAPKRRMII